MTTNPANFRLIQLHSVVAGLLFGARYVGLGEIMPKFAQFGGFCAICGNYCRTPLSIFNVVQSSIFSGTSLYLFLPRSRV